MTYKDILNLIEEELAYAERKFPGFPEDPIHASAVVAEEAGELTRASLMFTYQGMPIKDLEKEAVQTATMAIRFLINIEKMKIRPSIQV